MEEYESYLEGWRQRDADERVRGARARERALAVARELAQLLTARYGARRVVLVGSLARGDFAVGSDIDLAVEGIAPDSFFAAGADLEAHAGSLQVDLLPLESATPAFLQRVAEEGMVLA